MNKKIILLSIIVFMIFLIGCEEEQVFVDPSIEAMDNGPVVKQPAQEQTVQEQVRKEPEAMMDPEPEPMAEEEPEPAEEPEPYCGDGNCDDGENCATCKDCACRSPRVCHNDECIEPRCDTDSDCADADECTVDRCYFPAHPNAYCGNEKIKRCSNVDDCCPPGCNANNDDACEPECGNEACEEDEEDTCPEDCRQDTECGNQECEKGEDPDTCPEDCYRAY